MKVCNEMIEGIVEERDGMNKIERLEGRGGRKEWKKK
jgi:hypothetical protein